MVLYAVLRTYSKPLHRYHHNPILRLSHVPSYITLDIGFVPDSVHRINNLCGDSEGKIPLQQIQHSNATL